ncbi:hypothetical protein L6164_025190 [Bauhinia variegata]|uniref:Uncharacterized protein n=1 Tax=Bauhinia variegata TaxID=167791 RepID=A0ACB9M182_BAUVA|nr:hypothetical protein L6164_025190 [Bauhinia variegata]
MAYQNTNRYYYRSWSPSDEYETYESTMAQHSKPKGHHHHVAFKTHLVESIPESAEAETSITPSARLQQTEDALDRIRNNNDNGFETVDQQADTFIQLEHQRIKLRQMMSMRAT